VIATARANSCAAGILSARQPSRGKGSQTTGALGNRLDHAAVLQTIGCMKTANPSEIVNQRLTRLRAKMAEAKLDVIVIATLPNAYYFSLFECSNPLMVITADKSLFLTDFRYAEAAQEELPSPWEFIPTKAPSSSDELRDFLGQRAISRVGFEENAPYTHYRRLRETCPAETNLVEAGRLIAELRGVKDPLEIELIAAAQRTNEKVLADVLLELPSQNPAELTELELQRRIRKAMVERGAEEAFPTIVAFGATSSRPHAHPGKNQMEGASVVLIDMGVRAEHYCSDMTRTFGRGEDRDCKRIMQIYKVVLEAQQAALAAVRDGVPAREVDKRARDVIALAGYGDFFGHGLGHGVGLEIHEFPTLNPRSEDVLLDGMVVTIEPGIYLPGVGGVRIEDLVLVTKTGYRNLTAFDKSWHILT
jgi:Xaa-Pro aminopeptidase